MKVIGTEDSFGALALDAPLESFLLVEEIERHAAAERVIFDCIALVDATEIFTHGDIRHPVQAVFNAPPSTVVPEKIAASLYALAYKIGAKQLPDGMSARHYVRHHLERLDLLDQVPRFRWGSKWVTLPKTKLSKR